MPAYAVAVFASRFDFRLTSTSAQCLGSTPSGQAQPPARPLRVLALNPSGWGSGGGVIGGVWGGRRGGGEGEGSSVMSRVVTLTNVTSRDVA